MNFAKQFKIGLDVGLSSFELLWKNKKLISYLGIPVLIGIIIELTTYNLFYFSPSTIAIFSRGIMIRICESFGWAKHIGLLSMQMIKLLVIIYASTALIFHVAKITKKHVASIKKSIVACFAKLRLIIIWSVISTAAFLVINFFDDITLASTGSPCFLNAIIFSLTLRILWSLSTLFVVAGIALSDQPIFQIFSNSISIIKKAFAQYLGAFFWLALVGGLSLLPFALLINVSDQIMSIIAYVLVTLICIIIATVHNIIKTKLYQSYQD